jgi:hypothetical protein
MKLDISCLKNTDLRKGLVVCNIMQIADIRKRSAKINTWTKEGERGNSERNSPEFALIPKVIK